MALSVASLNSGSNGNCYYLGTDQDAVLIDGGLSCRETLRRMKRLGLNTELVRAIFISHEHADHISGVSKLAKKMNVPVFITPDTFRYCPVEIPDPLRQEFKAYSPVVLGSLTISAFPKLHDASDPHSFIVSTEVAGTGEFVRVGVFTDIGIPCEHVIKHFVQCHAAFLEANYDEMMLEHGTYPIALKNRIRGGRGHLSNKQALQLFTDHRPTFMTHLFLSHLSHHNNSPKIVQELFQPLAGNTKIIIASRYRESEVFTIEAGGPVNQPVQKTPTGFAYQLDLFR